MPLWLRPTLQALLHGLWRIRRLTTGRLFLERIEWRNSCAWLSSVHMSNYEIYHNPRCSKSRATLKLLEENGIEPKVRLYLEEPPSAAELKKVLKALNLSARKIIREGEDEFRSEKLADKSLTDADLIAAMLKHPRLIQRPIVIRDRKAARIGRPPESVAELWK